MLQIKEIKKKSVWEQFLQKTSASDFYPFFQSWDWGEVQKELENQILRLGLYDGTKLVGVCLVVVVRARRGHYLHVRHGPVLDKVSGKYFDFMTKVFLEIAKEKRAAFIRISPLIEKGKVSADFFIKRGFYGAPLHNMDAQFCWILPIQKSEEELLAQMRKSHRYTIKKSIGMDIKIIRTTKMSDIDVFLNIYNDLYERKGITPHTGIREEFAVLTKENKAVLFLAKYDKKIISAALIVFMGNTAIYHHGASLLAYRTIPASYLIQWHAIQEAKARGLAFYNFWGIAPLDQRNHPWHGLTLFKTGFGGYKKEFINAKDLPVTPLYIKTYLIESFFKLKRGY